MIQAPGKPPPAPICHILFFFNYWISNGFFKVPLQDRCFAAEHTVHALMQAHTCSTQTHEHTVQPSCGSSLVSPCPLPSPCPSLSQIYFIINQLVAHLPACCFFFLSIKHLLLLV